MKLTKVHQLLMFMAIVMGVLYALHALNQAWQSSSLPQAVIGLLAIGFAGATGAYLRRFRQRLAASEAAQEKAATAVRADAPVDSA